MTLLWYKIFQIVVEQKSFLKASDVLHLTPSAISHAISSMESELGFPLFIRTKSGVQLTSYGENLLPSIRAIINSEEYLMQEIASFNGLQKGSVKIATFNSVCTTWIPKIVESFTTLYPNINIEIYQGTYDDIVDWIKSGVVDLGFLSTSSAGGLSITPLYKDRLMCVVPKGLVPINKTYITLEDIKGQFFVSQRESCDADISIFFKKYGLKVRSNCYVVDDQSTIAMVESGFGICIMPKLVMEKINYNVNIYPIEPSEYRIIGISVLKKQVMAPAVAKMFEHIINLCQQCC